jgi:hypothetical protein
MKLVCYVLQHELPTTKLPHAAQTLNSPLHVQWPWLVSTRYGASSSCGWRNGLQYGDELRMYCASSRGRQTRGGPPARGLSDVITPYYKILPCYVTFQNGSDFGWSFGTYNTRGRNRTRDLTDGMRGACNGQGHLRLLTPVWYPEI